MIDIRLLREDPEGVRRAIARKKFDCDIDAVLRLDEIRRARISEAEQVRARQKAANTEMAAMPKGSAEFKQKVQELKALSEQVHSLEAAAKEAEEAWHKAFLTVPNVPDPSVPEGKTAEDNVTVSTWGDPEKVSPHACPHFDIPWFNSMLDFPRGVKVTGAGFPFYIGDMARLVRAMICFFLEEARKNGYVEFLPPILVNAESATATGQLPDKEGMMYADAQDALYMVPTAEVPVTNFFRDEILDEKQLPVYRCAYTPCFRREAGSWGKDVRGLNRLHQFDKVELVKWVHPSSSVQELEKLRTNAEGLLQKLGIPYRVLAICTKDIGFPHSKQYDLEVWAGGQKRWLEVSSCSSFTDFQARRANIRFRPAGGGKPEIVHTLNGSGLAIPRTLAALLENNLDGQLRVRIPECLRPWFDQEYLDPKGH